MAKRLKGKCVLITRAAGQLQELAGQLRSEGARVLELPTIYIVLQQEGMTKLGQSLDHIGDYDWLILTSVNTVLLLQDLLQRRNQGWSLFAPLQIACIGKATAAKVQELGGNVSLVPPRFQAESLAEELTKHNISGKKIVLPRAAGSREILPQLLRQNGALVDEIHIYRAELPDTSRQELARLLQEEHIDFITFTSSSTVRNFMEMAAEMLDSLDRTIKFACIGPITAETLREYGLAPAVVAKEFTIPGLVNAIASVDPSSAENPL